VAVIIMAVTINSAQAGKLTPPSRIEAQAIDSESVRVTWRDRSVFETGFNVRATDQVGATVTKTVKRNRESTVIGGLQPSTAYDIQVRAFNDTRQSAWSDVAFAETWLPPDDVAPTIVFVDPADGQIIWGKGVVEVQATDNVGVVLVEIFVDGTKWGESAEAPFDLPFDTETVADGQHQLIVRAHDAAGNSSAAMINVMIGNALAAPTNLTATAVSPTQIDLAWEDNTANEGGFEIERSLDSGLTWQKLTTVGANVTSFSDTSLVPATTYHYRVRACRGCAPHIDL
jgi:hypothetical protein